MIDGFYIGLLVGVPAGILGLIIVCAFMGYMEERASLKWKTKQDEATALVERAMRDCGWYKRQDALGSRWMRS